jgi:hypothetical protein
MINKIPYIVTDKELVEYTFAMILEYIEIWDDSLQIGLAYSIVNLFTLFEEVGANMANTINPLIKFCMKMISTEVSNVKIKK